jgi:hypothetical protein
MSIARTIAGTVIACALLISPRARAADDSINDEARRHFTAGVALLQDPDGARYEEAYREFEAAYASSLSPQILGNIGFCAMKLERDDEAITSYSRYLREAHDIDPAEAEQITRDVATLRAGLVRVMVTVEVPNANVVDKRVPVRGESVTNLYGPVTGRLELGLRPGHHIIDIKAHGELMEPWEFDAKPGATLSHSFVTKRPVPAEQQPHRSFSHPVPWVVTGLGAATLAAGGVVGALTLGKVNTIASNCPGNVCPHSYTALKSAQDDTRRFVNITDGLLVAGGVVTAAGVWLLFSMSTREASRSPSPTTEIHAASARPSFSCSPSGCFAGINGTF